MAVRTQPVLTQLRATRGFDLDSRWFREIVDATLFLRVKNNSDDAQVDEFCYVTLTFKKAVVLPLIGNFGVFQN